MARAGGRRQGNPVRLRAGCTGALGRARARRDRPADPDFELRHIGVAYDGSPEAERAPEGVDPETVIVSGFPSSAIAGRVAGVIDLLVVGSRRHGPLQRALLGSTSRAIGVEVDCALLVTSP